MKQFSLETVETEAFQRLAAQPDGITEDAVLSLSSLQAQPEAPLAFPEEAEPPYIWETIVNPLIIRLQTEVNGDVAGWLTVPNTNIDYPFVAAEDNQYYVERDIYENQAKAGSIFIDYLCAPDFSGFNTILYGHNMKNRSMFGDLRLFADESFLASSPAGTVLLKGETYTLEFFAFMVVRANDPVIFHPAPDQTFYFDYVKENARVYREPMSRQQVVTLSTCSYEFDGARMVVLASAAPLPYHQTL
jgi:sortase B